MCTQNVCIRQNRTKGGYSTSLLAISNRPQLPKIWKRPSRCSVLSTTQYLHSFSSQSSPLRTDNDAVIVAVDKSNVSPSSVFLSRLSKMFRNTMPGKFFIARSQIIPCGVTDVHSFKKNQEGRTGANVEHNWK